MLTVLVGDDASQHVAQRKEPTSPRCLLIRHGQTLHPYFRVEDWRARRARSASPLLGDALGADNSHPS